MSANKDSWPITEGDLIKAQIKHLEFMESIARRELAVLQAIEQRISKYVNAVLESEEGR